MYLAKARENLGRFPVMVEYICHSINRNNGKAYVGRTTRSLFLRFQEHVMDYAGHFGQSLRDDPNGFVVLLLETSLRVLCSRSIVNRSPHGFPD